MRKTESNSKITAWRETAASVGFGHFAAIVMKPLIADQVYWHKSC
jgi:hypothetical protein